jgi:cell division protein ZapE
VNVPNDVLGAAYAREIAKRGFESDRAQLEALRHLERLRAELATAASAPLGKRILRGLTRDNGGATRGVYLWGGVGRGKTWLMDLFCEQLAAGDVQRLHYQHLMREVHRQLALSLGKSQERPLRKVAASFARRARVLCVDEFAVQDIGDAMLMDGLLDGLLRQGTTLVCTSNIAPRRLYENGLQRARFLPAIDLIERRLDVVEIGAGLDYRLRELQGIFADFGIPVDGLGGRRRPLCRPCLDWSERRHHLGGSLGSALLTRFFDLKWARRDPASRAVHFSPRGLAQFEAFLDG